MLVFDVKVCFFVWEALDFVIGEGMYAHSSLLKDVREADLVLRRMAERL